MNLVKKQKIAKVNQAVTTSRQVAEVFGKEHKHVMEAIRKLTVENSTVKSMFIESTFKNRGRDFKQYIMNRDGYTLLAMGFTGARALEFKIQYITAFNLMEQMIEEHKIAREVTRQGYKGASQALRDYHGGDVKMHHFSNEADMRNRIVLGMDSKTYKKVHGVKDVRDNLETEQLEALAKLEQYDEMLLDMGLDYPERKARCEEFYLKTLQQRLKRLQGDN